VTDVLTSEELHRSKQDEIRAAKEAVAGPIPLIADAPKAGFKLPRGLFDRGVWHKEVEVRELTGADEEALAKVPDQLAFFSTVIALGVTSIGSIDLASLPVAERKFRLGELLLGEREQLFLQVVQTSFGDEKVIPFTCNLCNVEQEAALILSVDLLPKEIEDVDTPLFHYVTKDGDDLEFRPAIGADQEEAMGKKGATAAEQNTMMIARCVTKRNGQLIPDPTGFSRNLGIRDRQALLNKLIERQPSVDLDVRTKCVGCGGDQTLSLGWGDLFRP
jgi:hypothetical protein